LAAAQILQLLIEFTDLLIDFFNFRCFFSRIDQQLRALLTKLDQLRLEIVVLFRSVLREGSGCIGSLGGVVSSLGGLAIVFGLEELLVQTGQPLDDGVLIWI